MSRLTLLVEPLGGRREGDAVRLDRDAAAHLRAARAVPGDEVTLTDGRGRLWSARLETAGGAPGSCTLLGPLAAPPDLPVELAFGVGARSRTLWLVEKAVELGARRLRPVVAARSRSVADAALSAGFWRKAERRAASALAQCGGAWLPEIASPVALDAYLDETRAEDDAAAEPRLLLDGDGEALAAALVRWGGGRVVRFLVGPEGGLEPAERRRCLGGGWRAARLGARTLRFETAAIACLTAAWLRIEGTRGGSRRPTRSTSVGGGT